MASDDVIELGSSDEDTEPATKKRKPPLNAMVHIPNRNPGLSIKPSKSTSKFNPACLLKGSIGKSVTVTKVSRNNTNQSGNIRKVNGTPTKPMKLGGQKCAIPIIGGQANVSLQTPAVHKTAINPLNVTGVKIMNKNPRSNPINTAGINPLRIAQPNLMVANIIKPLKAGMPKSMAVLPPGITVKRTIPTKSIQQGKRFKTASPRIRVAKPSAINCNEVVTLDDDEPVTSSASGRQWYVRPEDQKEAERTTEKTEEPEEPLTEETNKDNQKDPTEKSRSQKTFPVSTEASKLEQENNKEPEKTQFIEITIEDSPLKASHTKKGFQVGAELPITIEDSPAKSTTDKTTESQISEDENVGSSKGKHSKKKLLYPKTIQMVETVEVEFEPLDNEVPIIEPSKDKSEQPKRVTEVVNIVEIEDSPVKSPDIEKATTPKKNPTKAAPEYKISTIETVVIDDKEMDEFSPIYQSFIKLCFELENSEDMKKIVEKKIKSYYRQVPKEYTESEAFSDMVSSKIMAIKAGPEKMYLFIKDIVDELNLQRKVAKQPPAKPAKNEEQEKFLYGEESDFDAKRQRQIRKLEKTLKKLHRAIQKLEEQEVDFDDEEDSVYILTDSEDETSASGGRPLDKEVLLQRYKERMVRVHAKLCQLTNTKMPSEARVQIDARPGQPKGPAKRLEKWINKKVPIGTPLPFPDFHDVLRCVRDANEEDKLGWNEADIMEEARDLFTRCGKKLQRRRQENEWRLAASRISADVEDPAEISMDLKKKLEDNRRLASKKEIEVFNKYADRQNQLNLEAVEIGDKEAEESPVETDEEEVVEDDSLISQRKRKERLKNLFKKESKKGNNKNESELNEKQSEDSQSKGVEKSPDKSETVEKGKTQKDDIEQGDKGSPNKSPSKHSEDTANVESNSDINKNEKQIDEVHSLSDDSNEVESENDKLHLLRKRFPNNSNIVSSDSGTPASTETSSTNEVSGDERGNKNSSDVISIENSSYSESEEKKGAFSKDADTDVVPEDVTKETIEINIEIEYSANGVEKKNKHNNEESNQALEEILLASSDDADEAVDPKDKAVNETCVNLRDDNISIGETVIVGSRKNNISDKSDKNTDSSSVESMEIGPSANIVKENGPAKSVETSNKSADEGSVTEITSIKSTELGEEERVETTSIKSVETIDDNSETGGVNSVESIEDGSISDETTVEPVVTRTENGAVNPKIDKYVINEDISENEGVKLVVSSEGGNISEDVKSVESVDSRIENDADVNLVDTTEDSYVCKMSDTEPVSISGKKTEKYSVKCVDTIKNSIVNDTENNVMEIGSINNSKTEALYGESEKSIANADNTVKSVKVFLNEQVLKSVEATKDSKVLDTNVEIETEDPTVNDCGSTDKTKANNDSITEPMEVDGEQT